MPEPSQNESPSDAARSVLGRYQALTSMGHQSSHTEIELASALQLLIESYDVMQRAIPLANGINLSSVNELMMIEMIKEGRAPVSILDHMVHLRYQVSSPTCQNCIARQESARSS